MSTSRNPITNDLIASRSNTKDFDVNYDNIFPEKFETISDNSGNSWVKCSKRCWLEVVGEGEVNCNKPNCDKKYI